MATSTTFYIARSGIPRALRSSHPLRTTRPLGPSFSTSANSAVAATAAVAADKPQDTKGRSNLSIKLSVALAVAGASLAGGRCLGSSRVEEWGEVQKIRQLSEGTRGCCSCDAHSTATSAPSPKAAELTEPQSALPSKLRRIVGKAHVYDGLKKSSENARFLKGASVFEDARLGQGRALCIVQPGTAREAVSCLQEIIDAGCVALPQGSNTGWTGGSVPRNDTSGRPAVVISTKRLDAHFPIDRGHRVVCLAGCGISALASSVQSWFPYRESHSRLGSSLLNPTTAAGVAFGNGGSDLRKGPATTDRALYCKVSRNKWGENVVTVVNTLGIKGLEDADFRENPGQDAVGALDAYANDVRQGFRRAMANSSDSVHGRARASYSNYRNMVCDFTNEVSQCSADTSGEDCNRSEGKVLILATVHDTFPAPEEERRLWVSFPDMETALAFRREVCLNNPEDLPISCEYVDRDTIDVIDRCGRIVTHMIRLDMMGFLWDVKATVEDLPFSWAPTVYDKLLHALNNWAPECIPGKFMAAGREWDHHCLVAVGEFGDGTSERFLDRVDAFIKRYNDKVVVGGEDAGRKMVSAIEAESPSEMAALNALRFVPALAFKTYCVGEGIQGVTIDYALPKNGGLAPPLPPAAAAPLRRMRHSHFGCNVVHEYIAYAPGVDTHKEKMSVKRAVEEEGGRLPAECGHGTEYSAPKNSRRRWMKMDPLNVMNPGVGGMSSLPKYGVNGTSPTS